MNIIQREAFVPFLLIHQLHCFPRTMQFDHKRTLGIAGCCSADLLFRSGAVSLRIRSLVRAYLPGPGA
jgi:hypothetical protein